MLGFTTADMDYSNSRNALIPRQENSHKLILEIRSFGTEQRTPMAQQKSSGSEPDATES